MSPDGEGNRAPAGARRGARSDRLIERGELEEAEALLERAGLDPAPTPVVHMEGPLWVRGRLRLAQGRDAGAARDLLDYGERCGRTGDQMGAPWRADAALACLRIAEPRSASPCAPRACSPEATTASISFSRTYGKLDRSSREQLPSALAQGP